MEILILVLALVIMVGVNNCSLVTLSKLQVTPRVDSNATPQHYNSPNYNMNENQKRVYTDGIDFYDNNTLDAICNNGDITSLGSSGSNDSNSNSNSIDIQFSKRIYDFETSNGHRNKRLKTSNSLTSATKKILQIDECDQIIDKETKFLKKYPNIKPYMYNDDCRTTKTHYYFDLRIHRKSSQHLTLCFTSVQEWKKIIFYVSGME